MGSLPVSITVEMRYSNQWNDVTNQVRGMPSDGFGISITRGRSNEERDVDFGSCTMTMNNRNGRFSPQNPRSPLYGLIGRNTPLRVTVEGNIRFVGEIIEWPIRWDQYGKDVYLPLEAAGILRRLTSGVKPIESALRRFYLSLPNLTAYVPLEEPSDTFRDAANLVPGQVGSRYVTSLGRRPGFGEGPYPEGSLPLPEWTPIEYFGWSRGASALIPGNTGWWGVQVTAMVPPNSGEVWLSEWSTDSGTYPWMSLKVNSSGIIQVFGSDQGDPENTFTNTYTARGPIDDGVWRTITVVGERNSTNTTMTFSVSITGVSGFTSISQPGQLGNIKQIRPRPMFAIPTGKEPLGLGHMATVAEVVPNGTITTLRNNFLSGNLRPPVTGFDGESAVNRIRRLALEQDIPVRIEYPVLVRDTFERTEVNSWGVADSGQAWDATGTAYNVNNGEGQIAAPALGIQVAVLPLELPDGEILVKVGFSALQASANVVARGQGANFYQFALTATSSGSVTYGIFDRNSVLLDSSNLDNALDRGWSPDTRWWIRGEAVGNRLQMKAWYDGDPEPVDWPVSIVSNLYQTGGWGLAAAGSTGVTAFFDDLTIWNACLSTYMGPQQVDTLVGNLRQAQDADHGILYETRDDLGLTYVPLCALYNQGATLELDYLACHLGHPLNPDQDDQFLANDVTVQRIGGTSARVVKETGSLSIQDPPDGVGTYDRNESLNLFDDDTVEDHAGWLLHLGTWPEARYSLIRIRNQAPQSCELDPHFAEQAAAVDTGKVISITNPPIWLPPEDIRALVQGYEEEIDLYKWLLRFNTSPANAYIVGLWNETGDSPEPAEPKRFDTCGSEITEGLVVTGAGGGYARTLDTAVLDITGDIDVRAEVYHGTWRPGSERTMVAKYNDGTNNRSMRFALEPTGALRFSWSTTGINALHALSDRLFPVGARRRIVRVIRDAVNGEVRFYTGESMVGPWTQFGSTQPSAPSGIFSGTANLEVGSRAGGSTAIWVGVIYAIQLQDGINGTVVADPRFDAQPPGTTNFSDDAGRPWEVLGAATIVGAFQAGADTSMSVTANPGPLWSTTATFPFDIQAAGVRLRVTAVSGVSSPQTFTIEQAPVNGIEKTIPGGTPISLWQPARYAI